jgi:hypothetical protein
MGGSDYETPSSSNSRIANSSRSWQAACDTDVADWDKDNDFIVALLAAALGHTGGGQVTMKVQWQRDSQGVWYDLAGSGELISIATTVLVHCTSPITAGNRSGCDGGSLTHGDSHEIEANNSCIIGAVAQNEFIEIQVAFDATNALAGETYSFRLYDVTAGAAMAEVAAEITMATAEVLLDGTIPAQSGASGALKATKELVGSIGGAGGASAPLKATREIVGSTAGQSGAVGDLTVSGGIVTLAGSTAGQSGTAGALSLTMELVGSIPGVSGTSSILKVTRTIAGSADGQSATAAVMKAVREIVGAIAAQSGAAGVPSLTLTVIGSVDAVSSLSGSLTVIIYRTEVDLTVNIATAVAFDGPLHRSLAIDGPVTRTKELEVEI